MGCHGSASLTTSIREGFKILAARIVTCCFRHTVHRDFFWLSRSRIVSHRRLRSKYWFCSTEFAFLALIRRTSDSDSR